MSNAIRIVVLSTNTTRPSTFQNKNYAWQSAAIYNGGDFPLPFNVHVEQGKEYPKGEYTLDPRSFQLDDKGNLRLKGIKLLPLGGTSAKA